MDIVNYQCLKVRYRESICFLQINRPEARNTINQQLVNEFHSVLDICEQEGMPVVVLEGLPDVFCFGADFATMSEPGAGLGEHNYQPEQLYGLWERLAAGPFVVISHVRGVVNAGGIGFVAASDIVIADSSAVFSLSEMIFGLLPACVLPFLIRKIGYQKANYLTLTTQSITVAEAQDWGLVDVCEKDSEACLRRHLLRMRRLSLISIKRYKRYMNTLNNTLERSRGLAVETNKEVFTDPEIMQSIRKYVTEEKFPWEA